MTSPLPAWLHQLADALPGIRAEDITRFVPPADRGREGAVLALFGEGAHGPDLLFIERAHTMRSHAGQPAFPGGKVDPGDASPVVAALREAQEEVGVDPAGVTVFGTLPALYLPPSAFTVTTVLGWWHTPCAVSVVDPAEVAGVVRVPVDHLADPVNRCRVRIRQGYEGPGFRVADLLVWGFTAGLVDFLLRIGGWERRWGPGDLVEYPGTITGPAPRPYDPTTAADPEVLEG